MLYGTVEDDFEKLITEKELRDKLSPLILPKILTEENLKEFNYLPLDIPSNKNTYNDETEDTKPVDKVIKSIDGYKREIVLEKITDQVEIKKRRTYRFKKHSEEVYDLLKEVEGFKIKYPFYMEKEFNHYVNFIVTELNSGKDPYTMFFGVFPVPHFDSKEPDAELKHKLEINKVNKKMALSERPILDTTLGFKIDGGKEDLDNFIMAKELGITYIYDADGVKRDITPGDIDLIIKTIYNYRFSIMEKKWLADVEVKKANYI